VRTKVTLRLVDEAEHFGLRYACDDCAHFIADSASTAARCAHGYPLGERLGGLREGREIEFCKEWEGA